MIKLHLSLVGHAVVTTGRRELRLPSLTPFKICDIRRWLDLNQL